MNRVDAKTDRNRKQDRRRDQHDRGRLHDIAGDQQQHVHEQQEFDPADAAVCDPAVIACGICSLVIRNENSTALVIM